MGGRAGLVEKIWQGRKIMNADYSVLSLALAQELIHKRN